MGVSGGWVFLSQCLIWVVSRRLAVSNISGDERAAVGQNLSFPDDSIGDFSVPILERIDRPQ
jgi:hypothetical protein